MFNLDNKYPKRIIHTSDGKSYLTDNSVLCKERSASGNTIYCDSYGLVYNTNGILLGSKSDKIVRLEKKHQTDCNYSVAILLKRKNAGLFTNDGTQIEPAQITANGQLELADGKVLTTFKTPSGAILFDDKATGVIYSSSGTPIAVISKDYIETETINIQKQATEERVNENKTRARVRHYNNLKTGLDSKNTTIEQDKLTIAHYTERNKKYLVREESTEEFTTNKLEQNLSKKSANIVLSSKANVPILSNQEHVKDQVSFQDGGKESHIFSPKTSENQKKTLKCLTCKDSKKHSVDILDSTKNKKNVTTKRQNTGCCSCLKSKCCRKKSGSSVSVYEKKLTNYEADQIEKEEINYDGDARQKNKVKQDVDSHLQLQECNQILVRKQRFDQLPQNNDQDLFESDQHFNKKQDSARQNSKDPAEHDNIQVYSNQNSVALELITKDSIVSRRLQKQKDHVKDCDQASLKLPDQMNTSYTIKLVSNDKRKDQEINQNLAKNKKKVTNNHQEQQTELTPVFETLSNNFFLINHQSQQTDQIINIYRNHVETTCANTCFNNVAVQTSSYMAVCACSSDLKNLKESSEMLHKQIETNSEEKIKDTKYQLTSLKSLEKLQYQQPDTNKEFEILYKKSNSIAESGMYKQDLLEEKELIIEETGKENQHNKENVQRKCSSKLQSAEHLKKLPSCVETSAVQNSGAPTADNIHLRNPIIVYHQYFHTPCWCGKAHFYTATTIQPKTNQNAPNSYYATDYIANDKPGLMTKNDYDIMCTNFYNSFNGCSCCYRSTYGRDYVEPKAGASPKAALSNVITK